MKKAILLLLLIPLVSLAESPIVAHEEQNQVVVEKSESREWVLKVGSELLASTKQKINKKALLLGLKVDVQEKKESLYSILTLKILPAFDQETEVEDFNTYLKENI